MVLTTERPIQTLVHQQRTFFATGVTKSREFRLEQLKKLKTAILDREEQILEALAQDFQKPAFEAYFEISLLSDIDHAIKHLKTWMKPKTVNPGLTNLPGKAKIYPEPLGCVLIIGPWNYPFSLALSPLVGAIAAGNCAIIKPSEIAPHTSALVAELISNTFESGYVDVIEGEVETSQALLQEKFDHIFFTGGTKIGKIVMEAAAKHLTPVTLELGGKSPCIVDHEIDLQETAKRITWGKFFNGGQTCVAPDYLLVDQSIKSQLLVEIKHCIQEFYGQHPGESPDIARIVNDRQFERLQALLTSGKIFVGGDWSQEHRYISPTVLDDVWSDSPVMAEEIFGPILPVLTYTDLEEAIALINRRPKPLALYLFSKNKQKQAQVLSNTSSGGVCINHTMLHLGCKDLPFGGVGESGIGAYHGKTSFDTFSHFKSVLFKPFWGGLNLLYPPYETKLQKIKNLLIK